MVNGYMQLKHDKHSCNGTLKGGCLFLGFNLISEFTALYTACEMVFSYFITIVH